MLTDKEKDELLKTAKGTATKQWAIKLSAVLGVCLVAFGAFWGVNFLINRVLPSFSRVETVSSSESSGAGAIGDPNVLTTRKSEKELEAEAEQQGELEDYNRLEQEEPNALLHAADEGLYAKEENTTISLMEEGLEFPAPAGLTETLTVESSAFELKNEFIPPETKGVRKYSFLSSDVCILEMYIVHADNVQVLEDETTYVLTPVMYLNASTMILIRDVIGTGQDQATNTQNVLSTVQLRENILNGLRLKE